ncbi:hypothetical protein P8452_52321 [Trifolium repens]|nr:hypothetical protein P8452_52321 [Trifolium repens]
MESPEYEYGVSCPYCFAQKSEEEKERARARQKQFARWGIIGGPDKGRWPTQESDSASNNQNQLSNMNIGGYDVLVVVDRSSKYGFFVMMKSLQAQLIIEV